MTRRAELIERVPELGRAQWLATDRLPADGRHQESRARREDLAFIQYTSGSTAHPKGVIVTHANIFANEVAITNHFEQDQDTIVVSWLPTYHDMGLVGCILNPLFVGGHVYLMPAGVFLKFPHRWLQAISVYGATTAAAPDFAYALCAREISATEKATLDLRRWRVAISGGEPVQPSTIARFEGAFAECGFRASAFRPSYGLAEGTLVVSAGLPGRPPLVQSFHRDALSVGRVEEATDGKSSIQLVSCGQWQAATAVRIVDPGTGRPSPADAVGEIWIRGESVASGYHGAEHDGTFGAFVDDDGPYCRTGDLGFVHRGELFVSGRLKDLIIVHGLNHHPEDIERSIQEANADIGRSVAVFSIQDSEEPRIIVVAEAQRGAARITSSEELEATIRKTLYERHQLQLHRAVMVRPGGIPRTTSGKVCRRECKRLFLEGELAPTVGGAT